MIFPLSAIVFGTLIQTSSILASELNCTEAQASEFQSFLVGDESPVMQCLNKAIASEKTACVCDVGLEALKKKQAEIESCLLPDGNTKAILENEIKAIEEHCESCPSDVVAKYENFGNLIVDQMQLKCPEPTQECVCLNVVPFVHEELQQAPACIKDTLMQTSGFKEHIATLSEKCADVDGFKEDNTFTPVEESRASAALPSLTLASVLIAAAFF